jgi:hypothetical protein
MAERRRINALSHPISVREASGIPILNAGLVVIAAYIIVLVVLPVITRMLATPVVEKAMTIARKARLLLHASRIHFMKGKRL